MIITCWGSRGALPVSGPEYIRYGGNTTCIEIRSKDNDVIILDAGSGIRKLGQQLLADQLYDYHIVLTHAHWDHIIGFPYFKPLYMQQTHVSIHGCPFAQNSLKAMVSRSMGPPSFPVNFDDLQADIAYCCACAGTFAIGPVSITPIALSHPNRGSGYRLEEDGKQFVFLTDNELMYTHPGGLPRDEYLRFCEGADVLFHDAEFTPEEYTQTKTWGHTSYRDALALAADAGVGRFGMFHHNVDRTDDELDLLVADARRVLSARGASMECFGVAEHMTIKL